MMSRAARSAPTPAPQSPGNRHLPAVCRIPGRRRRPDASCKTHRPPRPANSATSEPSSNSAQSFHQSSRQARLGSQTAPIRRSSGLALYRSAGRRPWPVQSQPAGFHRAGLTFNGPQHVQANDVARILPRSSSAATRKQPGHHRFLGKALPPRHSSSFGGHRGPALQTQYFATAVAIRRNRASFSSAVIGSGEPHANSVATSVRRPDRPAPVASAVARPAACRTPRGVAETGSPAPGPVASGRRRRACNRAACG